MRRDRGADHSARTPRPPSGRRRWWCLWPRRRARSAPSSDVRAGCTRLPNARSRPPADPDPEAACTSLARHRVAVEVCVARDTGGAILAVASILPAPRQRPRWTAGRSPEGPAHVRDPARALTAPTAFAVDDHCVVILPAGRQSLAAALSLCLSVFVTGPGAPVGRAGARHRSARCTRAAGHPAGELHQQSGVLALTVRLRGVPPASARTAFRSRLHPEGPLPARCVRGRRASPRIKRCSFDGRAALLGVPGACCAPDRHTVVCASTRPTPEYAAAPPGECAPRGVAAAPARRRRPSPDGCVDVAPDDGDLPGAVPAGRWRAAPLPGPRSARRPTSMRLLSPSTTVRAPPPPPSSPPRTRTGAHHLLRRRRACRRRRSCCGEWSAAAPAIGGPRSFQPPQPRPRRWLCRLADRGDPSARSSTHYVPCLFRAPYGDVSPRCCRHGRRAAEPVQWDVDPAVSCRPPWPSSHRATAGARRIIVLMHDGGGPREQSPSRHSRIMQ